MTDVGVTSITASGSSVILTLATRITAGQAIKLSYKAPAKDVTLSNLAVQNTSGVDASGFAELTVTNTVAAMPTVKLNGASATMNEAGEYAVSGSVRVTVDHVRSGGGLLGTNGTRTVDSSGGPVASPSTTIHSVSNDKYDMTFSNGPVGGLTTIRFGDEGAPLMLVKLRWQSP